MGAAVRCLGRVVKEDTAYGLDRYPSFCNSVESVSRRADKEYHHQRRRHDRSHLNGPPTLVHPIYWTKWQAGKTFICASVRSKVPTPDLASCAFKQRDDCRIHVLQEENPCASDYPERLSICWYSVLVLIRTCYLRRPELKLRLHCSAGIMTAIIGERSTMTYGTECYVLCTELRLKLWKFKRTRTPNAILYT